MPDTKQELGNGLLTRFSLQEIKWQMKEKYLDFEPGNLEFKSWFLLLIRYVEVYLAQ